MLDVNNSLFVDQGILTDFINVQHDLFIQWNKKKKKKKRRRKYKRKNQHIAFIDRKRIRESSLQQGINM